MIFLSVGNNELPFTRLFINFEKIFCNLNNLKNKNIEVVCQVGHTEYYNKNFKIIKFMEKEKFIELIKKSNIFISHAGAGSVINSIQHKKIPILLPRKKFFNEHIDDHQVELYKMLRKKKLASSMEQIYCLKNIKYKKIKNKIKINF